jgi:hypothetical protein
MNKLSEQRHNIFQRASRVYNSNMPGVEAIVGRG